MATKQLKDRLALLCDDCGDEIFANENMVMLGDKLWKEISDKHEDAYCDCCIEKRMGRPIEIKDFKLNSGIDFTGKGIIPCNAFWLWEKRRDEYFKIFPEHKSFDKR
ncbi:MAG: hypothetical protein AABY15_02215 [Nanoarchaeota archaeon]